MTTLPRSAATVALLALVLSAACRARRPEFSVLGGRDQMARALGRPAVDLEVHEDGPGTGPGEWIVAFKLQGYRPLLQARFVGRGEAWVLQDVREYPEGSGDPRWVEPAVQVLRMQRDAAQKAAATIATMEQLAELVERIFTDRGEYPRVDLGGLRQLVLAAGHVQDWSHDRDGWGNRLAFHAAADGGSYIIVSSGADGKFDPPLDEYFSNTDEGIEAYDGPTGDPNADIVYATGAFVQRPATDG